MWYTRRTSVIASLQFKLDCFKCRARRPTRPCPTSSLQPPASSPLQHSEATTYHVCKGQGAGDRAARPKATPNKSKAGNTGMTERDGMRRGGLGGGGGGDAGDGTWDVARGAWRVVAGCRGAWRVVAGCREAWRGVAAVLTPVILNLRGHKSQRGAARRRQAINASLARRHSCHWPAAAPVTSSRDVIPTRSVRRVWSVECPGA